MTQLALSMENASTFPLTLLYPGLSGSCSLSLSLSLSPSLPTLLYAAPSLSPSSPPSPIPSLSVKSMLKDGKWINKGHRKKCYHSSLYWYYHHYHPFFQQTQMIYRLIFMGSNIGSTTVYPRRHWPNHSLARDCKHFFFILNRSRLSL